MPWKPSYGIAILGISVVIFWHGCHLTPQVTPPKPFPQQWSVDTYPVTSKRWHCLCLFKVFVIQMFANSQGSVCARSLGCTALFTGLGMCPPHPSLTQVGHVYSRLYKWRYVHNNSSYPSCGSLPDLVSLWLHHSPARHGACGASNWALWRVRCRGVCVLRHGGMFCARRGRGCHRHW